MRRNKVRTPPMGIVSAQQAVLNGCEDLPVKVLRLESLGEGAIWQFTVEGEGKRFAIVSTICGSPSFDVECIYRGKSEWYLVGGVSGVLWRVRHLFEGTSEQNVGI